VPSVRVEKTLELAALWNSGDVDRYMDELGDDFEFTPDPSFPETGPFRGEALRAWMHQWASTWKDNELEVLETEELPSGTAARCRWHLEVPESGIALPVADFTIALLFDDSDRAVGMIAFFDHDRALRAMDPR
jgi:hypothetical protein